MMIFIPIIIMMIIILLIPIVQQIFIPKWHSLLLAPNPDPVSNGRLAAGAAGRAPLSESTESTLATLGDVPSML